MTQSDKNDAQLDVIKLILALTLSYLAVAMPLPVLSGYTHQHLGLGADLGGLAVGIAFLSTLLTRGPAGDLADGRGGKKSMQWGLIIYCVAGLICMLSHWLSPLLSYGVLLLGRLLLGVGESFTIVGMVSWGIGLMGPARSGRVMAWLGMGMYGAFALGGPVGLWIYQKWGFIALMAVCALLPLIGWFAIRPLPSSKPIPGKREPFFKVVKSIWALGAVVGLQGVGFALLGAFITQYFDSQHWAHAGWGLTCFGGGFVLVRILCGHLPDKIGGGKVAFGALIVEAVGQYLLWGAGNSYMALLGALLTGMGCSMVYPAMGVEVVKMINPQQRGTALGAFSAFQDLAYGVSAPLCGLLVGSQGFGIVYLIGGIAASLALVLLIKGRVTEQQQAQAPSQ
ncbi:MFS transporter [Gallaecimonas mangrovi]|uniref:MFS transporter n=1 Tax=Gallaecimonas mangrovi TaxID=2291597 RepID=UPI000E1FE7EB|nr:MFS transporter [Gallaecimonas mangrovi]